ncbi:MAG: amylo-alpha-1,6-glucosidase [Porphyromonas sp.]|nr:amylo-alpha-1,6-glucosidase [Porphyromonas sp.]
MSYLKYDKRLMGNLDESLHREYIRTNRMGAYCCSSIVDCNTRKYHGSLVIPIPSLSSNNHVLLSSLDVSIIQHDVPFNIALHQYRGDVFSPKGHKYIREYNVDIASATTYRVGGVVLRREMFLCHYEHRILYRYTLLECHSPTKLRFSPMLAFRDVKMLTHRNEQLNRNHQLEDNGLSWCLYAGYPRLSIQFSQTAHFVDAPHWNEQILYYKERERGYEHTEDLYVPGYFECDIELGKPIYVSAGIEPTDSKRLAELFEAEYKVRIPRLDFRSCLLSSAQQFYFRPNATDGYLLAGYPWFGVRARDLFVSLPGCSIYADAPERYERIMETVTPVLYKHLQGAPVHSPITQLEDPDILLWVIWAVQQFAEVYGLDKTRKLYGQLVLDLLHYHTEPHAPHKVKLAENGLLYAEGDGSPLSWMDAKLDWRAVVPRRGYLVEVNALWYNALMFTKELLPEQWQSRGYARYQELIERNFRSVFANEHGYLYDYVTIAGERDLSVRPNMLFAASLPYSPLSRREQRNIVEIVTRELRTPKGLRSLSPNSYGYRAQCCGTQRERELSYYNGSVWPWLLGPYFEAYLRLYGRGAIGFVERTLIGMEEEVHEHGIGTISELFDGNPPYRGRGAISLAMNVGEILRSLALLERSKQQYPDVNPIISYDLND